MEAEELHNERKLEVRVTGKVDSDPDANDDDNVIYYDLTNKDWEIVKITKHDWRIEKHGFLSSIIFLLFITDYLIQAIQKPIKTSLPGKGISSRYILTVHGSH
jgi:hypothetical protein